MLKQRHPESKRPELAELRSTNKRHRKGLRDGKGRAKGKDNALPHGDHVPTELTLKRGAHFRKALPYQSLHLRAKHVRPCQLQISPRKKQ